MAVAQHFCSTCERELGMSKISILEWVLGGVSILFLFRENFQAKYQISAVEFDKEGAKEFDQEGANSHDVSISARIYYKA